MAYAMNSKMFHNEKTIAFMLLLQLPLTKWNHSSSILLHWERTAGYFQCIMQIFSMKTLWVNYKHCCVPY